MLLGIKSNKILTHDRTQTNFKNTMLCEQSLIKNIEYYVISFVYCFPNEPIWGMETKLEDPGKGAEIRKIT
jgi:hypothetical protein